MSLPLLVTPHPLNDLTPDRECATLRAALIRSCIEQLTGQGELDGTYEDRFRPSGVAIGQARRNKRGGAMSADSLERRFIELEDSWEAVNEWFLAHDLTDGLPIVPPTQARVAAMTDYVERAARLATRRRDRHAGAETRRSRRSRKSRPMQ